MSLLLRGDYFVRVVICQGRFFLGVVTFAGLLLSQGRYFRGVVTSEESLLWRGRYFRGIVTFAGPLLSRGHYFREQPSLPEVVTMSSFFEIKDGNS